MIQRIQSVYLFVAALSTGLAVWFVPLFTVKGEPKLAVQYPVFLSLFLITAAISLFTIFRYKKRQHQVVGGRLNIIIDFVLFGLLLYMYFSGFNTEKSSLGLGSFLPLIHVVLTTLANRAIMHDEAMVRAADRFR